MAAPSIGGDSSVGSSRRDVLPAGSMCRNDLREPQGHGSLRPSFSNQRLVAVDDAIALH
jgi:hypothetical protein